eukprot:TRINITY_DN2686_c0_g1_i3.p1 TRINITY_DN2686_c0_g1~~TRINITY_DN2686_c0_g1_i3.p1  ORF type:complete len:102 (-),score=11.02 TRINITY_DN2686_c0_g1_i3:28-333(-)
MIEQRVYQSAHRKHTTHDCTCPHNKVQKRTRLFCDSVHDRRHVVVEADSRWFIDAFIAVPVSYTHLRAHETPEHLVCRLLLEKKKKKTLFKYTNIKHLLNS